MLLQYNSTVMYKQEPTYVPLSEEKNPNIHE